MSKKSTTFAADLKKEQVHLTQANLFCTLNKQTNT